MAWRVVVSLLVLAVLEAGALAQRARLEIDATDLPRLLLVGRMSMELDGAWVESGEDGMERVALWYPKWVPGAHAPGGPVANIGGLIFRGPDGGALEWRRTPGDPYRIVVELPRGARRVSAEIRYIANQSFPNSHGLDAWGSESLGLVSPSAVLVYPEGADMWSWTVACSITLPEEWTARCAMETVGSAEGRVEFAPVSLERLVDTPIMAGRFCTTYDLVEPGVAAPPHRMHVFSESEGATRIHDETLARFRRMVTQAARMFGGHPFESFDILLATTDVLPRNGLEHRRSTMNVIPLGTLDDPDHLVGWDRLLVPHEYVHAWVGKHRVPTGMLTRDMHTPLDMSLLWVYEGLTQYLGELLEVRSGMQSEAEYRWLLSERFRWAAHQQGRTWRSLRDTAESSPLLRGGSTNWGHLRRDQDYYFEGALVWMEADAIIRAGTGGAKSLDDFCRAFFGSGAREAIGFERGDVVRALGAIHDHDWDEFFAARIERVPSEAPESAARAIGYVVEVVNEPPEGPGGERIDELDARDSLGMQIGRGGRVRTVLLGSPADRARLGPGMRIVEVGDRKFDSEALVDAIARTVNAGGVDLVVEHEGRRRRVRLDYGGGPRFLTMRRDPESPDVLAQILAPR